LHNSLCYKELCEELP